ncbi:MAG: acyl-CoA dehydrogenase family protein [Pseudomonadales bacterium]
MEFGLSEEQVLLQDNVLRFLSERVPLDQVRRFASGEDPRVLNNAWSGLTELGVPALLAPDAAGGIGLKPLDAAIVAEALGRNVTPAPFLGSAAIAIAVLEQSLGASEPLLATLASGSCTVGLALSEASGSRENAQINAKGEHLNGRALHVLDFGSDHYLTASADRHLYLVDAHADNLEQRELATIDRTRRTGELLFNNTPARLLTEDPRVLEDALALARVLIAADTVGAASAMLEQAVAYAKEREQFNRPIASFQAVKHMCAEMAAALEPCRAMVWYAAHALSDSPDEAHLTACHTKAHVSEMGTRVAKTATEVHGGMGFTDLLGLHYWFKRIGYNRQTLGSPEYLRRLAAQAQGLLTSP